ncbi:4Fe-4S dicluster domain-containing protein [Clostridium chromiireducens]|uniref:4Fe-4S dicluster domain-containing protein n=1 Tax=Clostridium chromiireducens TaxID=225345 RepID=A0A964W447_9CLOT|nr:EFR1 family ferrodoxin [Clostridium chromiireducens]MVX66171.1 4Fe-4S dicluster domain-containing protein [Clostridium chromiireducens]
MKGLIFYFSGTGTTKLAADYIVSKINNIDFDFHDMNNKNIPDIKQYTILGFATYAQFFSPPKYVENFIESINKEDKKYVFVFNTYGLINGNTLSILGDSVKERGYKLIAGFALNTPESSLIMIKYKITSENAPNEKELIKFNEFIRDLDKKVNEINRGIEIKEISIKKKRVFTVVKKLLSGNSLVSIGEKHVNKDKCIKCKMCQEKCPYEAIYFEHEYPKFDEKKCESCFICYNNCPTQAIYSNKHKSVRYRKPNDKVIKKLKH